jgi:hypothetical protein
MRSGQSGLRARPFRVSERWPRGVVTPIGLALVLLAQAALAQTGEAPPDAPSATEDTVVSFPSVLPTQPPTAAEVLVMPRPPTHGAPVWQYSEPDPKLWEWLRLKSGEWLKGEITVLRNDDLEFESDELNELTIDWDDVTELRSPRISTYTFIGRRIAVGRGYVTAAQVTVVTGGGIMNFPRNELLSIIPGEQSEINLWSAKIGAGVTVRGGNTEQTDILISGRITRRGAFARFLVDYRGNYGTVSRQENVNNHKGDIRFDLFIWDRLFLTPFQLEVFRDPFQNVKVRISPGAGLGYELVRRKKLDWSVDAAGLYRLTEFVSVFVLDESSDETFALRLGTHIDWDITKRIELDVRYNASIAIPEVSDTNQHAEAVLSVELTKIFDLDTTFIWDRTGDPTPEANGTVPVPDDYMLSVGLSIDF